MDEEIMNHDQKLALIWLVVKEKIDICPNLKKLQDSLGEANFQHDWLEVGSTLIEAYGEGVLKYDCTITFRDFATCGIRLIDADLMFATNTSELAKHACAMSASARPLTAKHRLQASSGDG